MAAGRARAAARAHAAVGRIFTAEKLAAGNLGFLQQYRHSTEQARAAVCPQLAKADAMGHASKDRVLLIGTDQRITSGPAAKRLHSKAGYMAAPERFAKKSDSFPLHRGRRPYIDPSETLAANFAVMHNAPKATGDRKITSMTRPTGAN
jgi:hypothetical protein